MLDQTPHHRDLLLQRAHYPRTPRAPGRLKDRERSALTSGMRRWRARRGPGLRPPALE
ncbi:hypothetical protein D187_008619 [Cystobacter fuscus DSM 2262]|uniref:Uncharacterized protein n=1 Tax=Cystobacter fuscus (strain ATCC 25194 / DSM 2262 / NBRC 100088 / M29) TaxID=1242864 RepID=S9PH71_CYSF2|nr:hypothetical protein D187_008619 [Cystobacter fuscus DSM 2262]